MMAAPDKIALDVGGYDGDYTLVMSRYARRVVTFEPNPVRCAQLRKEFRGPRVQILSCALSEAPGKVKLFLPYGHDSFEGCATMEPENPGYGQGVAYEIDAVRLDDLSIADPVGLVKVDVEGHELAVLRGGRATLDRNKPNLIIEAEERHRTSAVATLRDLLAPLQYRGFFLYERRLLEVSSFDPRVHQQKNGIGTAAYALNFLWSVDPAFPARIQAMLDDDFWSRSRARIMVRAFFG
jgi:FkbM family methyltransferase